MKKSLLFLCLMVCAVMAEAQTPMYFNTTVAAGNNSFPFNTATSRKVQWRILANSLGAVAPGNNITKVWFQTGSTATGNYPLLNISLKQGPSQFSGGGLYETGMTVVYSGTNVTVSSTTGGWIGFNLMIPFLYNPNLPLFVEVEHNGTSGVGPTVYQNSPVGPGSGRQYGNYPNTTYTGADATVVNFGIDVIPATPCTAAPPVNSVVPSSFTTCPGLNNPALNVAATYSFGGLTYQWYSSTLSPVGPFSPIPNSTTALAPTPTLGVTTWFQLVATCTNITSNNSTTLAPAEYFVGSQTSSVVPYYEDFENVQMDNRLPNCSWSASSLGIMNQSSINSGSGNRVPRSGSKFASFSNSVTGTSYYYTNPIQMNSGITYSAALWYATEYFGYSNWSNISILVGTSQTPTGLVQVASVGPAISGPYKLLDGTFTVPTSGQYYIAIRATSSSGGATYLTWDDLSVTIPCTPLSGNSPTVTMSASSNTICAGTQINLNATGGDTYLWYDGTTTSTMAATPLTTTILSVAGTNTLTNCTTISNELIIVNPTPTVIAVADKYMICPGQSAYLTAYGANNYIWQGNPPGNVIKVNPLTSTSYTVQGSNNIGCSMDAVVNITVMPSPTVIASSQSANNESCMGDLVELTANGANTYVWYSSTSPALLQGQMISVVLQQPATFTVIGQSVSGCTTMATVNQNVVSCVGLESLQGGSSQISMFPNPTNGMLQLDLNDPGDKTIEITDISGRVVFSHHTSGTQVKLDLSGLAAGVYNATVKSENTTYSSRLIKN